MVNERVAKACLVVELLWLYKNSCSYKTFFHETVFYERLFNKAVVFHKAIVFHKVQ